MNHKHSVFKALLALMGILTAFLVVELGFRAAGGLFLTAREIQNRRGFTKEGTYRILCLGESTTQGQWPPLLEEELNKESRGVRFKVIDKGRAGASSETILLRLDGQLNAFTPHMVVVMMGINDGEWVWKSPEKNAGPLPAGLVLWLKDTRLNKLATFIADGLKAKITNRVPADHPQTDEPAGSESPEELIERGDQYLENGDYGSAERFFASAMKLDPENLHAYSALGNFYRAKGDFKKAKNVFEAGIKKHGRNPWLYNDLGYLHRVDGEPEKAERMHLAAISLDPENRQALMYLGDLYRLNENHEKAEGIFKRLITLDPENSGAYVGLGGLYRDDGKVAEAEKMYETAIKIGPKDPQAYIELGKLRAQQGNYQLAEELYEAAIRLNPKDPWIYDDMKILYRAKGEHGKAENLYEAAIEANPVNTQAYVELAKLYAEKGDYTKAKEILSRGQRAIGSSSKLRNALSVFDIQADGKESWQGQERTSSLPPSAARNYRKLRDRVLKRGIKLLCMQYPMRDGAALEEILGTGNGLIYVENKNNFAEAIHTHKLADLFVDMFAGDFGHCTELGNRLIAKNLSNAILAEVFGAPLKTGPND